LKVKNNLQSVGLLANPSSGYDVRRLVSSAETVTNLVKVNRIARFFVRVAGDGTLSSIVYARKTQFGSVCL